MADPIGLAGVEEQHLVRFGDGLVAPHMAHIDAAIGEHELRGARAFLRTLMPAAPAAIDILDADRRRLQQRLDGELGHGLQPRRMDARTGLKRRGRDRDNP